MNNNTGITIEEKTLLACIEAVPDPACFISAEGVLIACNRPFESLTGMTAQEMSGRSIAEFDSGVLRALSEQAAASNTGDSGAAMRPVSLANRELTIRVSALSRNDGNKWGSLCVIRDVTRERMIEEELRQFSRAVEQSPATVVITDTEGNIEYVNPKFTSLTGYTYEEVMGANPRILKSGEQPAGFYSDLWETLTSGGEWRGEFHNRKKNGDYYWEFASISPLLNEKGVVTHYIAVKEDISARKEAEEALRNSEEKLRSRNLQMEKDLKIAQTAQKELLRADIPESPYMKCVYRYEPLDRVGGDVFSIFRNLDSITGVFIGDISGHGIAAALFIALLKSATDRMYRKKGDNPSEYLSNLNRELRGYLSSYFLTGIYGRFQRDDATGVTAFTFSNGGHPLPVHCRASGEIRLAGRSNTIIGIMENPAFEVHRIDLEKGDRLFLYTDGIPETENRKKEIIGFDGDLLGLFGRSQRSDIGETLDAILNETTAFRDDAPLLDDISLIGFEIL